MSRARFCLAFLGLLFVTCAARADFPVRTKGDGTFVAATAEAIGVRSQGKLLQLKLSEKSTVAVSGQLAAEQLKNGTIVRVTGPMQGSEFEGEVKEIKVHTPADGYEEGLLQDGENEEPTVIGKIYSFRNGALTILAARKRYTAKIAEDAEIRAETKDYRVARPGDLVHFNGYVGSNKSSVSAREIEITLKSADKSDKSAKK